MVKILLLLQEHYCTTDRVSDAPLNPGSLISSFRYTRLLDHFVRSIAANTPQTTLHSLEYAEVPHPVATVATYDEPDAA